MFHFERKIVLIHTLYWVVQLILLSFIWGTYDGEYYRNFIVQLWSLPSRIIVTYVTLGFLFPRFLYKERYVAFALSFLILLYLSAILIQRPIIIFLVEGIYLPYNSPSYFNLIAIVNTAIDLSIGVIPLLFLHHFLGKGYTERHPEHKDLKKDYIILKEGHVSHKVPYSQILVIESQKNYLLTKTSDKEIRSYGSMTSIEEQLPGDMFLRIHRSFIINISKIDHYSSRLLSIDGQDIPIGRQYKKKVTEVLKSSMSDK